MEDYGKALCKYDHIEEIDPNEVDGEIDSILADLAYDMIYEELSSELPQPALRLGWGFLLRNGTPEGVPHYHHSVC